MSKDMGITGGAVSYERSRKIAEYENKKASITFACREGDDAVRVVTNALALAMSTVHTALGISEPIPVLLTDTAVEALLDRANAAPAEKPTTTRRPRKPPTPETPTPAPSDPAALTDDTSGPQTAGTGAEPNITKTPEDRKDPAALDADWTGDAPEITDKELLEACNRAASVGGSAAQQIKKIIGELAGVGKGPAAIPQAARAGFLEKLKAIKA
ncbi:MAG: hypothetical protein AB7F22_07740 [Reyranella sp.]|uniref:hypothetical protein n=1 Tax=Reyranella sp. TaxID=1929291 RepID=UPI003D122C8A